MRLLIVVFIAFSMQCSLVCAGIGAVPIQTAEEKPIELTTPKTETENVQTSTESALAEKTDSAKSSEEIASDANSKQMNKLLDVESTSLAKEVKLIEISIVL